MNTHKSPEQIIADRIREQIKNINQLVLETTPLKLPESHFTKQALVSSSQGSINNNCNRILKHNTDTLSRKLCDLLELSSDSMPDLSDSRIKKITWGVAVKMIAQAAPDFHEAASIFSLLHNEKLDVALNEAIKKGFDRVTDITIADTQVIILKGQITQQEEAQFSCDFDCIAALNTYFNALERYNETDKAGQDGELMDTIKERASRAIQEALFYDYNISKQCVHSLFMESDSLVFGDDWNNPSRLTPENILDEPNFKKKTKDFYKQALMKEVKVVLSTLQPTTNIQLDAVYHESTTRPSNLRSDYDMIFLKFGERAYEVWQFQFENLVALQHKIGAMTSNEIEEIKNDQMRDLTQQETDIFDFDFDTTDEDDDASRLFN